MKVEEGAAACQYKSPWGFVVVVVVIGLFFLLFSIQEASIHSSTESHVKDARVDH